MKHDPVSIRTAQLRQEALEKAVQDVLRNARVRSFWRESHSRMWSFYCPLCATLRKIPYRPRPGGARQVAQVGLTAVVFALSTWQWFGWKGLVSFVPMWTVFEIVYRGRVRAALVCPQCGFDPYLYLTDVPRARREIEAHWRKRFAEKGIPFPEKTAEKELRPAAPLAETGDRAAVAQSP